MEMTLHQTIFAAIMSITVFIFIFELLRRRKLKEEYSWLWLLTGVVMMIMIIWYDLLIFVSKLIGAIAPTTTLFIFAILFLLLLSIHYSIIISKLTHQIKDLTQEITIMKSEIQEKAEKKVR